MKNKFHTILAVKNPFACCYSCNNDMKRNAIEKQEFVRILLIAENIFCSTHFFVNQIITKKSIEKWTNPKEFVSSCFRTPNPIHFNEFLNKNTS